MSDSAENQNGIEEAGDQRAIRLQKLNALRAQNADPFAIERYDRSHTTAQIADEGAAHWALPDAEREALTVSLAGRLTAHRTKGKVTFADIRDESGRIQIYVKRDDVGDAAFERFNDTDLSDFIGVKGFPFITRTGERSLHVKEITLLAKALRPVPFGKTDAEGHVPTTRSPMWKTAIATAISICWRTRRPATFLRSAVKSFPPRAASSIRRAFWKWKRRCCNWWREERRRGLS